MNVGSPREESKPASNNSPAPSVGEAVPALPKYEKDDLSNDDEDNDEDKKISAKTTHLAKDAVVEPSEKEASTGKDKKKRTWKKPEGMPKRPLSAYNLFFKEQRQELLGEEVSSAFPVTDQTKRKHRRSHGKVGFQEMASIIGKKWKALSPSKRKSYEDMAAVEKAKYKEKVERWRSGEDDVASTGGEHEGGAGSSAIFVSDELAGDPPQMQGMDLSYSQLPGFPRNASFASAPSAMQHPMQGSIMPGGVAMEQHRMGSQYGASTMTNTALVPPRPSVAIMPTAAGLTDSGRMIQGQQGTIGTERMLLSPQGDSEGGRLNHLQRMYELRVREAALLREEMHRSAVLTGGSSMGGSLPGQNYPNRMGQVMGDTGHGGLLAMGATTQPSQGVQPNLIGQRRVSLGSSLGGSMRSMPQQQPQYPNDLYMFSPGGQQQLRQAEEAWQNQLALGNPGNRLSQMQQHQQPMGTDPVAALREQRARLLQQALENDRAYLAEDELQRFLRRQTGPGGGM